MAAAKSIEIPERLRVVFTLAQLLQRLEGEGLRAGAGQAGQYRQVAARLHEALRDTPADDALDLILRAFPAASEVYENLHYDQAGLVRQPLEASLNTEQAARALIGRLKG